MVKKVFIFSLIIASVFAYPANVDNADDLLEKPLTPEQSINLISLKTSEITKSEINFQSTNSIILSRTKMLKKSAVRSKVTC